MCLSMVDGGDGAWTEGAVFTSEQVMRLTGISRQKLAYWLQTRILFAEMEAAKGRGRVRLYSFRNLVEVRTAMWLRDKVSLQLMRKILDKLRRELEGGSPLADMRFGLVETTSGFRVVVKRSDASWELWESGQQFLEIAVPVGKMGDQLVRAVERDRRARRRAGKVERRRGVLGSTPVLAGTRIPTRAIWSLHRAGYDTDRIVANYPGLTPLDVQKALEYERGRQRIA
jgi:uncharacterized protein (DUF433 family)